MSSFKLQNACLFSILHQGLLDTAYWMEIMLVLNVDRSIIYGVSASMDTKYSSKSGNDFFPHLKTVCSMLTTDEMRLKLKSQSLPIDSSSSSRMIDGISNCKFVHDGSMHAKPNNPSLWFASPVRSPATTQVGQSSSNVVSGHETILPHAFSAMTLHDPITSA
nr:hypothetical protein [Tanacetum cinerariifolium]